jgi:DNA-cytosine methyltransferase
MRKLISLYTGCGGLDLGFEAAGFDTAVAVEIDPEAVATLRHNRDWPVLDRDIHSISSTELLSAAGLQVGEADALIGGPPCQPFSKAGYWASGDTLRLDDARAGTLGAYLRVLRDTQPRTFLLENVPGLAYHGKSEGLDLITRSLGDINRDCGTHYSWAIGRLDAANFGVPQIRERVFVVGARNGTDFFSRRPRTRLRGASDQRWDCGPTPRPGTLSVTWNPAMTPRLSLVGSGRDCCRRFPKARTTSGTPSAAAVCPCSAGGADIGAFCSSWRKICRPGRSRRNPGPPWVHSIGRIVG